MVPDRLSLGSHLRAAASGLALAVLIAGASSPLVAGDWYVDARGDCVGADGSAGNPFCRIQEAIDIAGAGDVISIAAGVYPENLTILKDLFLSGAGAHATIVDGQRLDRVVNVWAPHDAPRIVVSLSDLTIRNGSHLERLSVGSGIRAFNSDLKLRRCRVSDNVGGGQVGWGGGLFAGSSNVTLIECTVSGNKGWELSPSHNGSGIFVNFFSRVDVFRSVVIGNDGHWGAGIYSEGECIVRDSLIVGNRGTRGAGIYSADGRVRLRRATIAGNCSEFTGGGVESIGEIQVTGALIAHNEAGTAGPDCHGVLTSAGYNLLGDTTDAVISGDETGNLYDVDPHFVDLDGPDDDPETWQDNDYTLRSTSPCVDAGDPELFLPGQDLNGMPRFLDGDLDRAMVVDIGAAEFSNVHLAITGEATPGGTLTIETTGKPGLIALAFFSPVSGEQFLSPYGTLFLGAPFAFVPFAVVPNAQEVVLPEDTPTDVELTVQQLAIDLFSGAGNFSNPVTLVIE